MARRPSLSVSTTSSTSIQLDGVDAGRRNEIKVGNGQTRVWQAATGNIVTPTNSGLIAAHMSHKELPRARDTDNGRHWEK